MADAINTSLTQSLEDLTYTQVKNGTKKDTDTEKRTVSNELGKEDFLQLLVCQLQNQDPLNPQEDTAFIAQLAQFSALEQMTNMNTTLNNTSAYTMVGKEVVINHTDSAGRTSEVRGVVDYVEMRDGDAYLSVDGKTYPVSELVQVLDSYYAVKSHLPSIEEQTVTYDAEMPRDLAIEINLGDEGYEATSVAVAVNGEYIDSELMEYEDGVLTISKEALRGLPTGSYYIGFFFNDPYSTTVTDKVTLKVVNGTQETEGDKGDKDESGTPETEEGDKTEQA